MPRPIPEMLRWEPTARWPTRTAFWEEPLAIEEAAALADKYTSLLRLIVAPDGAPRSRGLRELAARWPGVLREGQLAPTPVLEARQRSLLHTIERGNGGPRATWCAAGLAAVPLWAEIHRLLHDIARIRAAPRAPTEVPTGLDADAQRRWPSSGAWWDALAWPLDARVSRSWLATVAGHEPSELDRRLRE